MTQDSGVCVKPGQRVELDGHYGTVWYVGEVPPTKGLWLGVDWDDPSRGKHDGSHNGRKYFNTRYPTSGSFVRMDKVNLGHTFPVAVRKRYGEIKDDKTAGINLETMALLRREIQARFIQVVGFDKVNIEQSQFQNLKEVWLREQSVNGPGDQGEVENLCPNLREVDLSKNLLSSWESIATIASQLRNLEILNVSENMLQIPECTEQFQMHFASLEHIIIAKMEYLWTQILECAKMWPNVLVLQVPFNKITTLEPPPPDVLHRLKSLDLEGNEIRDWNQINKLGMLQNLTYLNVSRIGVSTICFPDCSPGEKTRLFPALKQLHISGNNIQNWQSINELSKLKSLEDLKFRDNPILEKESSDTARQLIIAKIPTLKTLNGGAITPNERRGAEIDYLKKYATLWIAAEKCKDANNSLMKLFNEAHPQYSVFVERYGALEEEECRVQSKTLNSRLITIELFSPNAEGRSFRKKVPKTMQVQKLSGLAQKLFNTGSEVPKLSCISSKVPDMEYPLDHELKELSFYSIEDGDRICVRW